MKKIASLNNPRVKQWRKLHNRRQRQKAGLYLIESFHLVEECILHQKELLQTLIICEDVYQQKDVQKLITKIDKDQVIIVPAQIASAISNTETNQGIFAEVKMVPQTVPEKFTDSILILDAVQDPGNVGTMIRTASAAGFEGVFLGEGTADLYNDKTLRAAQGSHFQMDVYTGDIVNFIEELKMKKIPVFATILDKEALSYKEVKTRKPFALIVGNEGAGIREEIIQLVDKKIFIPMSGPVESLNVAIASSIIMFHLN